MFPSIALFQLLFCALIEGGQLIPGCSQPVHGWLFVDIAQLPLFHPTGSFFLLVARQRDCLCSVVGKVACLLVPLCQGSHLVWSLGGLSSYLTAEFSLICFPATGSSLWLDSSSPHPLWNLVSEVPGTILLLGFVPNSLPHSPTTGSLGFLGKQCPTALGLLCWVMGHGVQWACSTGLWCQGLLGLLKICILIQISI